jgi:hypothetical protein
MPAYRSDRESDRGASEQTAGGILAAVAIASSVSTVSIQTSARLFARPPDLGARAPQGRTRSVDRLGIRLPVPRPDYSPARLHLTACSRGDHQRLVTSHHRASRGRGGSG